MYLSITQELNIFKTIFKGALIQVIFTYAKPVYAHSGSHVFEQYDFQEAEIAHKSQVHLASNNSFTCNIYTNI